jgi:hypothetical protein
MFVFQRRITSVEGAAASFCVAGYGYATYSYLWLECGEYVLCAIGVVDIMERTSLGFVCLTPANIAPASSTFI